MTNPTIAVYYDSTTPGLIVQGAVTGEIYPPMSLSAQMSGDDDIIVYIGQGAQSIVGPVPYDWIANAAGQPFASAALTLAYLEGQFAQAPAGGGGTGEVFDEFFATNNGAMTKNYNSPLPAVLFVYVNGLLQSSTEFTISGVTLSLSAGMNLLIGDTITILT